MVLREYFDLSRCALLGFGLFLRIFGSGMCRVMTVVAMENSFIRCKTIIYASSSPLARTVEAWGGVI